MLTLNIQCSLQYSLGRLMLETVKSFFNTIKQQCQNLNSPSQLSTWQILTLMSLSGLTAIAIYHYIQQGEIDKLRDLCINNLKLVESLSARLENCTIALENIYSQLEEKTSSDPLNIEEALSKVIWGAACGTSAYLMNMAKRNMEREFRKATWDRASKFVKGCFNNASDAFSEETEKHLIEESLHLDYQQALTEAFGSQHQDEKKNTLYIY